MEHAHAARLAEIAVHCAARLCGARVECEVVEQLRREGEQEVGGVDGRGAVRRRRLLLALETVAVVDVERLGKRGGEAHIAALADDLQARPAIGVCERLLLVIVVAVVVLVVVGMVGVELYGQRAGGLRGHLQDRRRRRCRPGEEVPLLRGGGGAVGGGLQTGLVGVAHAVAVNVQPAVALQGLHHGQRLQLLDGLARRLAVRHDVRRKPHHRTRRLDLVQVAEIVVVLAHVVGAPGAAADDDAVVLADHVHLHAARLDVAAHAVAPPVAGLLVAVVAPDAAVELLAVLGT